MNMIFSNIVEDESKQTVNIDGEDVINFFFSCVVSDIKNLCAMFVIHSPNNLILEPQLLMTSACTPSVTLWYVSRTVAI
jgi:hypothetical protein